VAKVFYDKSGKGPSVGLPIAAILRLKPTKGDVGIEVEVEASSSLDSLKANSSVSPWWNYHHDGSLRGYDNAEFVLAKPILFAQVNEALTSLWSKFDAIKAKLDDSNRTSIHVHLNCQNFHLNRLTAFCALYFCFEEVLTEWCGEHRVGNLFCLRAKDAPAIISQIRRFIRSDGQSELRDGLHYSGLNVSALSKFGSIEVRTLRGVRDPVIIENWVAILQRLYQLSAEFPDPRDVCAAFSQGGPLAFFDTMLGEMGPVVREGISFNDDRIRDSMYEGIRLAQDLCYCRDWDKFKAVEVKADPFGRDPAKIANSLANQVTTDDMSNTPMTMGQYLNMMASPAPGLPKKKAVVVSHSSAPYWDTYLSAPAQQAAPPSLPEEEFDPTFEVVPTFDEDED